MEEHEMIDMARDSILKFFNWRRNPKPELFYDIICECSWIAITIFNDSDTICEVTLFDH